MSPLRPEPLLIRPRRLRGSEPLRALVRETHLSADQLILPLFVRPGTRVRAPIPSMPGQFQLSVDAAAEECRKLHADGVPAVLLFGLADRKDDRASRAYARDGIVQQAVAAIKRAAPGLLVITDVCLCAYMTHGHCGVLRTVQGSGSRGGGNKKGRKPRTPNPPGPTRRAGAGEPRTEGSFWIENDATLELLARTAVSHAEAGADLVAPSDMMDGTVGVLRRALDGEGFERIPIMAYAAKFASVFYGPFRDAVDSAPRVGDRRTYQMDPANAEEAVREAALDVAQGADIVMVKPALAYLDVVRRVKERLRVPVAAFNVSGEYAMVKAVAGRGWLPEAPTWLEILLALKRAGADILITYWAREAAKLLKKS